MHNNISLYRKRFIPNEIIHLKDDIILSYTPDLLITKWDTLKPRKDISRGISAYFLSDGYKISKVYNQNNELVYWYCDIINTIFENDKIICEDLLLDVIVYENGSVHVVDVKELADAMTSGIISVSQSALSLTILDSLLETIYSGNFLSLQKHINDIELSNN